MHCVHLCYWKGVTLKYKLFYFTSNKVMLLDHTMSSFPSPRDYILYVEQFCCGAWLWLCTVVVILLTLMICTYTFLTGWNQSSSHFYIIFTFLVLSWYCCVLQVFIWCWVLYQTTRARNIRGLSSQRGMTHSTGTTTSGLLALQYMIQKIAHQNHPITGCVRNVIQNCRVQMKLLYPCILGRSLKHS